MVFIPNITTNHAITYTNIILHIEMSIVNLKIIFVKKQKQTLERPTQGRGATFIITDMAVFTLACVAGGIVWVRD